MGGLSARTVGTLLIFAVSVSRVYLNQTLSPHIFTETTVFVFQSLPGSQLVRAVCPLQLQTFTNCTKKIEMVAFVAFKVNKAELMICAEWDWGISGYLGSNFLLRVF